MSGPHREIPHEVRPGTQLHNLLVFAQGEIGKGEVGENNAGPYVEQLFRGKRKKGNWCAAFVAHCLESVHICPPIPDEHRRGAKGLVKYLANDLTTGQWVARPRFGRAPEMLGEPRPGDVIAWHRSPGATTWREYWRDWHGHVELISSVASNNVIVTIAGNVGRAPAKVKRRYYTPAEWQGRLYGFARLGVLRG